MKGLATKHSHQQGPPLLQITTCKKSRHLHRVLTLKHSHGLLTATVAVLVRGETKQPSKLVITHC